MTVAASIGGLPRSMHERHGVVVFDLDVVTGIKFQATDVPSVRDFTETYVFSIIFDLFGLSEVMETLRGVAGMRAAVRFGTSSLVAGAKLTSKATQSSLTPMGALSG